jgi:DNA-binding beta-propeller fold protein YncE
VAPDGKAVYLGADGAVHIIDPIAKTVLATVQTPRAINHLAVHPSKSLLYATAFTAGAVYEVNTRTQSVTRVFTLGGTPQGSAVSPDGSKLYITNEDGSFHVVNLTSGDVSTTQIAVPGFGLALTRDGEQVFIAGRPGEVKVVDPAARTVLKTIGTGGNPARLSLSPDGRTLVVANFAGWVDFIR